MESQVESNREAGMIDFDPNTQEALLTQDLAMKFLVWAVYYNDLELSEGMSFAAYGAFDDADAQRLDRVKDALFKCFGAQSVANASFQMRKARQLGEPCPFGEDALNALFGTRRHI